MPSAGQVKMKKCLLTIIIITILAPLLLYVRLHMCNGLCWAKFRQSSGLAVDNEEEQSSGSEVNAVLGQEQAGKPSNQSSGSEVNATLGQEQAGKPSNQPSGSEVKVVASRKKRRRSRKQSSGSEVKAVVGHDQTTESPNESSGSEVKVVASRKKRRKPRKQSSGSEVKAVVGQEQTEKSPKESLGSVVNAVANQEQTENSRKQLLGLEVKAVAGQEQIEKSPKESSSSEMKAIAGQKNRRRPRKKSSGSEVKALVGQEIIGKSRKQSSGSEMKALVGQEQLGKSRKPMSGSEMKAIEDQKLVWKSRKQSSASEVKVATGQAIPWKLTNQTCEGNESVPRLIHLTWFYPKDYLFAFRHYICLLSALKFIRPKSIMFWNSNGVRGKWWDEIVNEVSKRNVTLNMMRIVPPTKIFGNNVSLPEHQSDIVRLERLIKYGGIYFDLDEIFVNFVDPLLCYDLTMARETDIDIGNGIMFAKAGALFLTIWHESYRTFKDSSWGEHSVIMPHKLEKLFPTLIHVEETSLLQPNYDHLDYLYKTGVKYNWRSHYGFQLYYRFLGRYKIDKDKLDDVYIRTMNNTAGEILRYVYYHTTDL